ncbi:hypothetical protein HanXRQr2_Chr11g0466861 [Helianthus annuus]|uniref:Uncharacterized protein n=1 Tax=Helianthus annuus TaxID=4232 RepID=A0A9K3MY20_HELAN|nr:hypothetical protein HanXRQr2_Chr11g0466861 [Helianthus annuus]
MAYGSQEACPKLGKKVVKNCTLIHGVDDGCHEKRLTRQHKL